MIPKRLNKHDKIGVISPSSPITNEEIEQFERGLKYLNNLGFTVIQSRNCLSCSKGYSASPKEKAADINEMFADTSLKQLLALKGVQMQTHAYPILIGILLRRILRFL
jgi:muramoyltetrapeptide carboxypeptidase